MKKILVTGATGQIGSELVPRLREIYGNENVIAAGHRKQPDEELRNSGPFCFIDVRNTEQLQQTVANNQVDTLFHLASLLSAVAENKPQLAWDINTNGLFNVLECARVCNCSVFFPSSIAAFGPGTPPVDTPQETLQRPNTIYGISKVTGELLCDYYYHRFSVDTRGLRFPGLISYKTEPGGGTTDYAVDIFHAAIKNQAYQCFLKPDTQLDMMYMPDAIRAMIELMQADGEQLIHRNAFNVSAMNFTPEQITATIQQFIPEFTISYQVDPVRQAIADSWPRHIDDRAAQQQWHWHAEYNLHDMVKDMLANLTLNQS